MLIGEKEQVLSMMKVPVVLFAFIRINSPIARKNSPWISAARRKISAIMYL